MTTRSPRLWLALLLTSMLFGTGSTAAQEIAEETLLDPTPVPRHPSDLEFDELQFDVPDGGDYRHTLSNGVVVYVVEDRQLPLVDLSVTLRVGGFLDPDTKPGLAAMTASMLRQGGAGELSAEAFDERVDFLAADLDSEAGPTSASASLNCIRPVLDESLRLLFDMLRSPRFQQDRLDLEQEQTLEALKQRNDRPQTISARNWEWLMRGPDHFLSRELTESQVLSLVREDLIDFHARYWQPDNMIIGVAGDVDTQAILSTLEERFAGWRNDGPDVPWPPPAPTEEPRPGVYYIQKDIPQGRVLLGHLGYQRRGWKDRDVQALAVMNEVLGGGGFTSRLVKRIRSDEGLAYSAFSQFGIEPWWPGIFNIGYQSKSATVALAAKIALEEIDRIRREKITEAELVTAKASFIDVFPRQFESARRTVGIFVRDELEGRPHRYWIDYRDRVRAVDRDDVQRVARKHLHPDRLVLLVVGSWEEIAGGDADGRASMRDILGGRATELPLRDPLTLEPLSN